VFISYSHAGVSRSVTLVVAYIMTVTTMNWKEALMAVKGARPFANPNFNFQQQLMLFDYQLVSQVSVTLY